MQVAQEVVLYRIMSVHEIAYFVAYKYNDGNEFTTVAYAHAMINH